MKCSLERLATVTLAIGLSVPMFAQRPAAIELPVGSHMDIYRAGGYNDGSNGLAPADYTFPAGPFQVLQFSSVEGAWTCNTGAAKFSADGRKCDFPFRLAQRV